MSDVELSDLRESLNAVASRTIPDKQLDYGIFAKEGDALDHTIITLVVEKKTGRPVAFNALAMIEIDLGARKERVLHLGLVMIDPQVRSQGLSWILYGLTCVFLFLRNQLSARSGYRALPRSRQWSAWSVKPFRKFIRRQLPKTDACFPIY